MIFMSDNGAEGASYEMLVNRSNALTCLDLPDQNIVD